MNDYEIRLRNERRYKTRRGRVCECGRPLNYLAPPQCPECGRGANIDPTARSGFADGPGRGRPPGVAVAGIKEARRLSGMTFDELTDATGLSPHVIRNAIQGRRVEAPSARILVMVLGDFGAYLSTKERGAG